MSFNRFSRGYRKVKGFREKLHLEEFEEFRDKLQLFSQEKQNIVDNPVMEFVKSDITITLIARKDKIQSGEELEIRAEIKRKDCTSVPNLKVWFVTSNSNAAVYR